MITHSWGLIQHLRIMVYGGVSRPNKWGKTSSQPSGTSTEAVAGVGKTLLQWKKVPELPEEFADVFRFWLATIPMAAETPEVDHALKQPGSCHTAKVRLTAKFKNTISILLRSYWFIYTLNGVIWSIKMCFFKISTLSGCWSPKTQAKT